MPDDGMAGRADPMIQAYNALMADAWVKTYSLPDGYCWQDEITSAPSTNGYTITLTRSPVRIDTPCPLFATRFTVGAPR